MVGVYVNDSSIRENNSYNRSLAISQELKDFKVNSAGDFIFCGAVDGNRVIPIPCYKTNRVTASGDRVYYPAISLSDAKTFKSLKNKENLSRDEKLVLYRVGEALDKCAESYGLGVGSLTIKRLAEYYEYFEKSGGGNKLFDHLRKVGT